MSKVMVISGEANRAKPLTVSVVTDWNKCALCQTKTTGKIQCPTKSTRPHYISVYNLWRTTKYGGTRNVTTSSIHIT